MIEFRVSLGFEDSIGCRVLSKKNLYKFFLSFFSFINIYLIQMRTSERDVVGTTAYGLRELINEQTETNIINI